MHYVDLNISPKKDKTGYWVLAKGESAPLVAEEQNKKLTILGTEKAMSMLKSELKNNGVKFETNGNKVIVDDSPKAKMAVKMVKERVGMQSIKLNENFNWDRISAEDASKLFDYHERTGMLPSNLSAEKYDEIMKKYRISRQDDSDIPFKSMTEGEQKLRSLIRSIIKEELNEGSIVINGKTVRTYTQNGDTSYNVTYDDGTKDRIAVNNDGWDEIYALHKNATNSELTEEPKYKDTMPKYRLGALKKLLDISIKDGSPQDVITNLQNAIQSLEKQSSVNEISPELFKRATDISRERGQDRRTSSMGEIFFNKFKNRPLMGGTIVNVSYIKPQSGGYEEVIIKIEVSSSVIPGETKFKFIYYDVKKDQWGIDKEITRADARLLSLIAQHINPNTRYKSGGEGFQIKGY